MSELEALRERVGKATGPDRALDRAILEACGWRYEWQEFEVDTVICSRLFVTKPDGSTIDEWETPHVTASIDAAVALAEAGE